MDNTTDNEKVDDLRALFIIFAAGFADEILSVAREEGLKGATILHSSAGGGKHGSFLGITVHYEKEIIISIVREETADRVMAAIKKNIGVTSEARTVCFTLPVDKAVGLAF